jgi:hypothetical protein
MKPYRRALYVLALVVAFIDVGIFYVVARINDGRIESQTPPLFEFAKWEFVTIYVMQIAVLVVCWWLIRSNPFSGVWANRVLHVLLALVVLRGAVFSYGYCFAPTDRARIAQTSARLGQVDRTLQEHQARSGALPTTLTEVNLPEQDLRDPWGFDLRYTIDDDGRGYQVTAIGTPDRLRDAQREVRRRFDTAAVK